MRLYLKETVCYQEVLRFVEDLKTKGYKLILLSNETKEGITNKINKFKLSNLFESIYCSAFLGMTKRNSKSFHRVIREEKLNKKEILFIDDRKHNVEVAKKLGINSIFFKNFKQLKEKLNKYI